MIHPKHRELNTERDVYLKISDILYFYKEDKADWSKTIKRLNFLKLIVKKNFGKEELLNVIEDAKNLLQKYDKDAYNKFMEKYKIEDMLREGSILKFFKK